MSFFKCRVFTHFSCKLANVANYAILGVNFCPTNCCFLDKYQFWLRARVFWYTKCGYILEVEQINSCRQGVIQIFSRTRAKKLHFSAFRRKGQAKAPWELTEFFLENKRQKHKAQPTFHISGANPTTLWVIISYVNIICRTPLKCLLSERGEVFPILHYKTFTIK